MNRTLVLALLSGICCTQGCVQPPDDASIGTKSSALTSGDYGLDLILPIVDTPAQKVTRGYNLSNLPACIAVPPGTPCSSHQHYGAGIWDDYYAIDIAGLSDCSGYKTPVLAAARGTVKLNDYQAQNMRDSYGDHHVVIDHGNGCFTHYAHLESNVVHEGQQVEQGQMIGLQGNEGSVSGSQCTKIPHGPGTGDDEDPTGSHLHFKAYCNGVAVRPEPLSGHYDIDTSTYFHMDGFTHLPTGTLVKVADLPEIYLVVSDGQLMHIPDWTTFVAHRFFSDASYPMEKVVTISRTARDCHNIIEGNTAWQQSKLVVCNGTDIYALFQSDSVKIKRRVPFVQSNSRYAPLIRSWGFRTNELSPGSSGECATATGSDLKMRPGTVVEEASDNDFWVIVSSGYQANDVAEPPPATYAQRLLRYANGEPFMPELYSTYGVIVQIPDGSLADYVTQVQPNEHFNASDARLCLTASGGSTGGGSSGAGSPTCTLGERSCADTANFLVCEADPVTGEPTWHTWPCGSGLECVNADGMCTQEVSTCTPGQRICLSEAQFADCQTDPATGETYWHPWLCGAGWECVSSSGQCTQTAYQGDAPHTIRCENHDYTYSLHVTGPVQNGLWSSVSGNAVYLQYGSNSDGWTSYVPSVSSKPYSLWVGDADASGNPYSHELVMRGDTDELNLFLYSPDSGQQGWFNLDWGIWNVIGDCWQDGGYIRHAPLPPPSGTITCTQDGGVMKYRFSGPMQMLLIGGAASGPIDIEYGSNTDGWTVPTAGKITAPWNGSYQHEITLPTSVNNLNFYLNGSGGGRWFDLGDGDYDGDHWTVTGACWDSGGLITHAAPPPTKTIDCQVDGPNMTVTITGDTTAGIFGTPPTDAPTYLEYGSDTDGWGPYTTGKPKAIWYAPTQLYTLQLSSSVQNMNFFLYGSSSGQNNWFDLNQWTVTGDCYRDGGGIRH